MTDQPWYPSQHTYTGEPSGQRVLPHYPTMPDYIRVYDIAVRNSGWRRADKKLWRKARTNALHRWTYPFEVHEYTDKPYMPNGITLGVQKYDPNSSNNYGGFGLMPLEPSYTSEYDAAAWSLAKGYVMIHPTETHNAFLSRVAGRLSGVLCHEFGHALGFGHGGTGIMRSAVSPPYYPNDEELTALHDYWGRA